MMEPWFVFHHPGQAHASTTLDGYCDAHTAYGRDEERGLENLAHYGSPRIWRISGAVPVDVRQVLAPQGLGPTRDVELQIAPGTRLRLDNQSESWYCDGHTRSTTVYRFCVLDGPLAGNCFEAWCSLDDDQVTHTSDPVEPVWIS